jgi:hypothetical protein
LKQQGSRKSESDLYQSEKLDSQHRLRAWIN